MKKFLAVLLSMSLFLPITTVHAQTPVVVVIDPGHGGSELGAYVNYNDETYYEKDMNLKMATAMYNKLSQYDGVKVYMTRTDDSTVSLSSRIAYAKKMKANVLFSVHVNAKGSASKEDNGLFALISNGHYRSHLRDVAKGISDLALQYEAQTSGMVNNGDLLRNSGTTTYPNNTAADYYYIVRASVNANIPGFIMEHGFIDNDQDFAFLSNDDSLKAMGEADAQAVIDYYHLSLKGSTPVNESQDEEAASNEEATSDEETPVTLEAPTLKLKHVSKGLQLSWNAVEGATSYDLYRKVNKWVKYKNVKATSFLNSAVKNGQRYSYKIVARNESVTSDVSNIKSAAYLNRTKIKKASVKKRKVTLTWLKNSKASGYVVRYIKNGKTYTKTYKGKAKTKAKLSLKKGSYKFSVRCYINKSGKYYSVYSTAKSVKVK